MQSLAEMSRPSQRISVRATILNGPKVAKFLVG